MIRSYIIIAWRNVIRNQTLSIINIMGLAVGMTFTLLISLWVKHELSFDRFHENYSRIGMIMRHTQSSDAKNTNANVPLPLYDELVASHPELKNITRLDWGEAHNLRVGDHKFMEQGYYADPGFLKMFSFPLISGDPETALQEPASIVVTEALAKVLFQNNDAVGKVVTFDNKHELTVTGVLKNVPENSSLQFEFLVPFEFNIMANEYVKRERPRWGNNFIRTIVELKEGESFDGFSATIENLIKTIRNDDKEAKLFAFPAARWRLYSKFENWVNVGGKIEYVQMFGIVGVLVLLIACINFMNLATARSEKRIKEVGIRKAIGSQKSQLVGQFIAESMLTVFIAFILSLLLANLVLPLLNNLGFENVSLESTFHNGGWLIFWMLIACIATGLVAGSYPALYLSSFIPAKALKGISHSGRNSITTRKVLVVTQFTFSIALVIGTAVVFRQIQFAKNRPLGYNPDNFISIPATDDLRNSYPVLKRELLNKNYIESVSKGSSPMTAIYSSWTDFSWAGKDPNATIPLSVIMTEYDYEKTTGVELIQGRSFSPLFADSASVLLNESAVRIAGFKQPIGEIINFGDERLTVVGVVKDVVMLDPFNAVRPAIYMFNPNRVSDIFIRLKPGADLREALSGIQHIVETYNPAYPFQYNFVDDEFQKKFTLENQVGKLAAVFAVLAVFISCLGLFGLVTFMAEQRVKEIGVRKVLGASVLNVWRLLSTDFVKLVIVSFIIATPVAYYFLENWLSKYNYRTDLPWWIFAACGTAGLVVTILTISFQAVKAATANPVKSLRSD